MAKPSTVLIAVHGDNVRQLLMDDLQALGLNTLKADNGVDALAAVMNFRPAGAVLTLQLPKIDGLRVAQLLRDVDELRPVRLVLVGPQELDAATLKKLEPAVWCPGAGLEAVRRALVGLGLLPEADLPGAASMAAQAPAAEKDGMLHKAVELMDSGQTDEAFDLLRSHIQHRPEDLTARSFLDLCRTLLFRQALVEFENLQLRPRRLVTDREVMRMALHSDEGFLLSFIDGVTRLRELFYLGGYDRPTTYILLRRLLHRGVIALK
jgi:CheY-like chemotaxis protein